MPLVDKSKLFVAQVQHGFSLFDDRQDFTYGIDVFRTRPDTEGTINGVYEKKDNMDEWGVYLQSKTVLSPKFDLILAGRVDDHSMLPDKVFSPRAGPGVQAQRGPELPLHLQPGLLHSLQPELLPGHLGRSGAECPIGGPGYTVRAFGTGPNGYGFQNPDGSLKGMRSPFAPGQFLPAEPHRDVAHGHGGPAGPDGPRRASRLVGRLFARFSRGFLPPPATSAIMLLNTSDFSLSAPVPGAIPETPGIRESYTETFEVGWQGILADKIRVSADVYYTKKNDFTSPLLVQNRAPPPERPGCGGLHHHAHRTPPSPAAADGQRVPDPGMAQATAAAQTAVIVPQLATRHRTASLWVWPPRRRSRPRERTSS